MKIFRHAAATLAVLAASTAFAAGHDYEITFHKEAPVKLTVAPSGAESEQGSLKFDSKEAEPNGSVRMRETDTYLVIELDWWQAQFEELSDGKGTRLSLPTGLCRKIVTVPLQSDKPVVIPCQDGRPPYASFDAVTIRRLD